MDWNQAWKNNAFFILVKIKNFIIFIKSLGSMGKFKQLDRRIFKLIDDSCVDFEYYNQHRLLDNQKSILNRMLINIKNFKSDKCNKFIKWI